MVVVEANGESYHMEDRLKERWDRIKDGKLAKKDEDRVYVVDGRERTGKSVFTMQQAGYIDPTFVDDSGRICFTPEEVLSAIRKLESTEKITKVIVFDEAFRGLSSRGALSKINKMIVQALMEMGQKNLVLFIVLPSFFLLDMYAAMMRSNALFHIYKEKGGSMRAFKMYSFKKKARLYKEGARKGWEYNIPTIFKGRFTKKFPGGEDFRLKYLELKRNSIGSLGNAEEEVSKFLIQRNNIIYGFKKEKKLSYRKMATWLTENGMEIAHQQVANIIKDVEKREKEGKLSNVHM